MFHIYLLGLSSRNKQINKPIVQSDVFSEVVPKHDHLVTSLLYMLLCSWLKPPIYKSCQNRASWPLTNILKELIIFFVAPPPPPPARDVALAPAITFLLSKLLCKSLYSCVVLSIIPWFTYLYFRSCPLLTTLSTHSPSKKNAGDSLANSCSRLKDTIR